VIFKHYFIFILNINLLIVVSSYSSLTANKNAFRFNYSAGSA